MTPNLRVVPSNIDPPWGKIFLASILAGPLIRLGAYPLSLIDSNFDGAPLLWMTIGAWLIVHSMFATMITFGSHKKDDQKFNRIAIGGMLSHWVLGWVGVWYIDSLATGFNIALLILLTAVFCVSSIFFVKFGETNH